MTDGWEYRVIRYRHAQYRLPPHCDGWRCELAEVLWAGGKVVKVLPLRLGPCRTPRDVQIGFEYLADAAAKAFRQFVVDVPWEVIDWAVMKEEGWTRA